MYGALVYLVHSLAQTAEPEIVWQFASARNIASVPVGRRPVPSALVHRGAVIRLSGIILDDNDQPTEGMVYVKSGFATRATGKFEGNWTLDWSTGSERGQDTVLSIGYLLKGESVLRDAGRVKVSFTETNPLSADVSQVDGAGYSVKVNLEPDITVSGVGLFVEGRQVDSSLAPSGELSLRPSDCASPEARARVQVRGTLSKSGRTLGTYYSNVLLVPARQDLQLKSGKVTLDDPDNPFDTGLALELESVQDVPSEVLLCSDRGQITGIVRGNRVIFPVAEVDLSTSSYYLSATTNKGYVCSKRYLSDELGVASALRQITEGKYVERTRMEKYLGRLIRLVSEVVARLGIKVADFYADDRDADNWFAKFLKRRESSVTLMTVDYEFLIPEYIGRESDGASYQQAVLEAFPRAAKGSFPIGTFLKQKLERSYFQVRDGSGVSLSWASLKTFQGKHFVARMENVEQCANEVMDAVAAANAAYRNAENAVVSPGPIEDRYTVVATFVQSCNRVDSARLKVATSIRRILADMDVKFSRWHAERLVISPKSKDDALGPRNDFSRGPYTINDLAVWDGSWWTRDPWSR